MFTVFGVTIVLYCIVLKYTVAPTMPDTITYLCLFGKFLAVILNGLAGCINCKKTYLYENGYCASVPHVYNINHSNSMS